MIIFIDCFGLLLFDASTIRLLEDLISLLTEIEQHFVAQILWTCIM